MNAAISVCLAAFLGASAHAQAADGLKLVWSDEFDADGRPNPQKWTYENGFVRNQEATHRTPKCPYGLRWVTSGFIRNPAGDYFNMKLPVPAPKP
jgi:hypothetical protein